MSRDREVQDAVLTNFAWGLLSRPLILVSPPRADLRGCGA